LSSRRRASRCGSQARLRHGGRDAPIGRRQQVQAGLDDPALIGRELKAVGADVFVQDEEPAGLEGLGHLGEDMLQAGKVMDRAMGPHGVVVLRRQ
jgi:hypothetical protein